MNRNRFSFVRRSVLPATLAVSGLAALALPGCIIVAGDRYSDYDAEYSGRRAPMLGVELSGVSSATATQAGVDASRTCIITHVVSNSAAERAGLQKYDIITHVDGKDWATISAVREGVRSKREGETLVIGFVRAGKTYEATATIGAK
ncbi:MAG: PDZ domain-containing protein [Phycisphaerales bacterium]|jgi:S1-C subfamily serine protease|nr:PDZ domain-containing protein [Phycisphaerales bacterium]